MGGVGETLGETVKHFNAVFVNNKKLTGNLGNAIRYEVGKEKARDHLTLNENWSNKQFDEVGWDFLHNETKKKPDGYKMWLSKQHSGTEPSFHPMFISTIDKIEQKIMNQTFHFSEPHPFFESISLHIDDNKH